MQASATKDIGDLAESVDIFAKLSPAQKESIITVLRERGHVVGYMGDGSTMLCP